MSAAEKPPVAVLGLGIVGSRACSRLHDAGWPVRCWNRTPKGSPGEARSAPEAVEGATMISLYLKDSPAVRAVVEEIAPTLRPGQIVLNHATLDLETTRWLAARLDAAGCSFLDAPFTGSKDAAAAGQLLYYTGGDAALAARTEAFLSVTSRGRIHCGDVGAATVVKLATNLISACTVQALAESLALVTRQGIPAGRLVEAVAENACASKLTAMKLPAMVAGNFDTHFSLANMAKDSRYMMELARASGLQAPAIAAVSQRLTDLEQAGLGGLDFAALAQPYLAEP